MCTHDVRGLYKFSITGLKRLSINVHPRDVREPVELMSDNGIPGMNGLGPESDLNVLNSLNGLGT